MKIKSIVGGMIIASAVVVVGASQAAVCTTTTCGPWAVSKQFTGTGWHMVPCNTVLVPARTWQQYTSGSYAPPDVARGTPLLLGL